MEIEMKTDAYKKLDIIWHSQVIGVIHDAYINVIDEGHKPASRRSDRKCFIIGRVEYNKKALLEKLPFLSRTSTIYKFKCEEDGAVVRSDYGWMVKPLSSHGKVRFESTGPFTYDGPDMVEVFKKDMLK